jgi:hypothetical protein
VSESSQSTCSKRMNVRGRWSGRCARTSTQLNFELNREPDRPSFKLCWQPSKQRADSMIRFIHSFVLLYFFFFIRSTHSLITIHWSSLASEQDCHPKIDNNHRRVFSFCSPTHTLGHSFTVRKKDTVVVVQDLA